MAEFSHIDQLVDGAIKDGVFPGAAYSIGKDGKIIHLAAAGHYMYCPDSPATKTDTIWDMASCSKVIGCTTAAMILFDRGELKLDEPVAKVLPAFGANGKEKITTRNLLLHDSGLVADLSNVPQYTTAEQFMNAVYALKLKYPTGSDTIYSDLNFITLGKMIEKITSVTLDVFVGDHVFKPLGMNDSMYNPPAEIRGRCAPTEDVEPWRTKLRSLRHEDFKVTPGCNGDPQHPDAHLYIQGEVHDPSALVLDGISGNAGVFSTAPDVSVFMQMMLDEGSQGSKQIVKAETVRDWTKRQSSASSRGLGWDTSRGPYSRFAGHFSTKSFGHTGFTGTSVWADPELKCYGVLLSNRVHPTSKNNKLTGFRRPFYDAVATACGATAASTRTGEQIK